jgi:hypothetical protein
MSALVSAMRICAVITVPQKMEFSKVPGLTGTSPVRDLGIERGDWSARKSR